ncbi:MAG: hypothetical protein HY302_02095 [Opitutae bacterium]|nr:hypothetical protein [Opitutae bacterium]
MESISPKASEPISPDVGASSLLPPDRAPCREVSEAEPARILPPVAALAATPLRLPGAWPENMPALPQAPPLDLGLPTKSKRRNYFLRHWRGEFSLGHAVWINLVCLNLPWLLAVRLAMWFAASFGLAAVMAVQLVSVVLFHGFVLWQVVGVARSAWAHLRRGGRMLSSILVWSGLSAALVGGIYFEIGRVLPAAEERLRIFQGDAGTPALRLVSLPSGDEIEMSGGLPAGSAEKFKTFLSGTAHVRTLRVNSIGGRVYEAQEIARVVARRKFDTVVTERCASAATLIFLAGKERRLGPRGKLGFHSAFFPGRTGNELAVSNAAIVEAMVAAGVARGFAEEAMKTPPAAVWYPSPEELYLAGVTTEKTPSTVP